ncbi:MAG: GNAT family N-acetyltransferase [Spirosomataceae bacterium]
MKSVASIPTLTVRTEFRPEHDIAAIAALHDTLYRREYAFGGDLFTHYVEEGLQSFARDYDPDKDRVWLCESEGQLVGSLVLANRGETAQLRYFLIHPSCRGLGLGKRLLSEFMQCLSDRGYRSCYLLTVKGLAEAAHLYQKLGFRVTEETASESFGVSLIEQRYDLELPYIRPAHPSDAPPLRDLMEQTFADTYAQFNTPENMQHYVASHFGLAQVEAELQDDKIQYLIMSFQGRLIGFAKLNKDRIAEGLEGQKAAEIERIYVTKAQQGQKLGAKLMHACLSWAQNAGYNLIWLGVWDQNHNALAFYDKMGFQRFGNHVFILGDDVQNDYLMKRELNEYSLVAF